MIEEPKNSGGLGLGEIPQNTDHVFEEGSPVTDHSRRKKIVVESILVLMLGWMFGNVPLAAIVWVAADWVLKRVKRK